MKTKHYSLLIVLAFVGGLILGWWIFRDEGIPAIPLNNYVTDTLWMEFPGIPPPLKDSVKPKVIIIYSGLVDSLKLIRINDSLQAVIDSTKADTVYIKDSFLTLFPKNPKLLFMDLKMDSLSLTFLDINASVTGYTFPLQLSHYRYRWTEDGLSASSVPYTPGLGKSRFYSELAGYAGYRFLSGKPMVGISQDLQFSRIYLRGDINTTIENRPSLELELSTGIKLKSWGRK